VSPTKPFIREAGGGPAVLCLHAGGANSSQWRALMERLAGSFRVLACDLSGCGRSPAFPPGPKYTLDEEVRYLDPAFEAAGDSFHLLGHSYGGAVALKAALRHRSRLRSLTLFEPVLFSLLLRQAPQSEAALEILKLADSTTRLAKAGDLDAAAQEFVDYWFQPGAWANMREEVRAPIRASMSLGGERWSALLKDPVALGDLRQLDLPALVLVAQKSTLASRALSRLVISALPNAATVDIPGVGHMAPLANPEQVNPLIEAFLREQAR
jgi:pimeloyl-ACP methyl ester carboxylesterase